MHDFADFRSANFHEICTQNVFLWGGKSFWKHFFKFALKGSFSKKNLDHPQWYPTSGRDFSEIITNLGKSWQVGAPMECWLSIRTDRWNELKVIPLASRLRTRKDFPTQSPDTEWLSSTHRCRTAMQLAHAALTWHYIIIFGRCVIAQLRVN